MVRSRVLSMAKELVTDELWELVRILRHSRLPFLGDEIRRETVSGASEQILREVLVSGATPEKPRGFGSVPYPKQLVRGPKVLLYGELGEVQAPGYLTIGQPLADQL